MKLRSSGHPVTTLTELTRLYIAVNGCPKTVTFFPERRGRLKVVHLFWNLSVI
jgi:hypothetical protein